jgi:hypothetical protein
MTIQAALFYCASSVANIRQRAESTVGAGLKVVRLSI